MSDRGRSVLLGVALSSVGWAALGYVELRSHGADVRLRPVAELNRQLSSGRARTKAVGTPAAQAAFLELLEGSGFTPGSLTAIPDVARLQRWVGNNVRRAGPYEGAGRGFELLRHGRQGGALLCGGMSDILREAVVLLGLPARTVQLYESSFRPRSTHVVVEVFVTGRWRVFDPTYNVTYEGEGEPLGVAQIQERLGRLGPGSIRPHFHGGRVYPADLERDAPGWRRLFANAYVSDVGKTPAPWLGLPPWRYWVGPTIYYFGDDLMPLLAVHEQLYVCVAVLMPGAALLAVLIVVTSRRLTRSSPSESLRRSRHE